MPSTSVRIEPSIVCVASSAENRLFEACRRHSKMKIQKILILRRKLFPKRCPLVIVRRDSHRSQATVGRSSNPKFRRLRRDSGQRTARPGDRALDLTNREQDSQRTPPSLLLILLPTPCSGRLPFAVSKEDCRCSRSSAESAESNFFVSPAQ